MKTGCVTVRILSKLSRGKFSSMIGEGAVRDPVSPSLAKIFFFSLHLLSGLVTLSRNILVCICITKYCSFRQLVRYFLSHDRPDDRKQLNLNYLSSSRFQMVSLDFWHSWPSLQTLLEGLGCWVGWPAGSRGGHWNGAWCCSSPRRPELPTSFGFRPHRPHRPLLHLQRQRPVQETTCYIIVTKEIPVKATINIYLESERSTNTLLLEAHFLHHCNYGFNQSMEILC